MTERKALELLSPDPNNARTHTEEGLDMIAANIKRVGAARSIVIDETDTILAGHATVEAAKQAGIEQALVVEAEGDELIAVRRRGLSVEEKRHLSVGDNRSAELSGWNDDKLQELAAAQEIDDLLPEQTLMKLGRGRDRVQIQADPEADLVICPACLQMWDRPTLLAAAAGVEPGNAV
jgi:ParB-like chromosome segregation protein Spo0J